MTRGLAEQNNTSRLIFRIKGSGVVENALVLTNGSNDGMGQEADLLGLRFDCARIGC